MNTELATGYERVRAVTRHHAKSFYFSSVALFGQRRASAFALYAFCRRLDDIVDGDDAQAPAQLQDRLNLARDIVRSLYGAAPVSPEAWHPAELAALRDTVERYRIPELPFQELISGMEMDLVKSRYANFAELDLYCYRVAGVVGLLMTPVLGCRDEAALPYAADLGRAMQLTNILRDVKEDFGRGRVYLPQDQLQAFGIGEDQLLRWCQGERPDARWVDFLKAQLHAARGYYARAQLGIPALTGFGSQRVVRLMSAVYGGILGAIEAQGYDVFASRAHLPLSRKVLVAARVLLTPNPRPQPLSAPPPSAALTDGRAV